MYKTQVEAIFVVFALFWLIFRNKQASRSNRTAKKISVFIFTFFFVSFSVAVLMNVGIDLGWFDSEGYPITPAGRQAMTGIYFFGDLSGDLDIFSGLVLVLVISDMLATGLTAALGIQKSALPQTIIVRWIVRLLGKGILSCGALLFGFALCAPFVTLEPGNPYFWQKVALLGLVMGAFGVLLAYQSVLTPRAVKRGSRSRFRAFALRNLPRLDCCHSPLSAVRTVGGNKPAAGRP